MGKLQQTTDCQEKSKIHYLFSKTNHSLKNKGNAKSLPSVDEKLKELKPSMPVYFLRPNTIKEAASFFLKNFTNNKNTCRTLYSVKSNSSVRVLKYLFESGIKELDVASISEVRNARNAFGKDVNLYFMHPIKSREAIAESYFKHDVRDFSLDSLDELDKILEVTNNASDLNLHVRLAIPNSHAAIDLSGKFGILPGDSVSLIKKTRIAAKKMGICFHVGSQCMDASQYRSAINIVNDVVNLSGVEIDVLDVGGGFPSKYPAMIPVALQSYFDEIFDAIGKINLSKNCEIWCEPGRALVAESGSLLVRVEARKQNMLYLNDGTYGGLFDAGGLNFIYPTKAIRLNEKFCSRLEQEKIPFGFYGPTCDSLDVMKGPFYLPKNIKEGDYIEVGQLGAYSQGLRTSFNGFGESLEIEVKDRPLFSMFDDAGTNVQDEYSY